MRKYAYILILLALSVAPLHADVKKESRHFLTTEAGIGYSALLNRSDLGKSSGLAGGKLQVGYEWNYRKLLVHTGIEFALINDRTRVEPFILQTPYTIGLPAGQPMTAHFDFQSWTETQMLGQVNIPIQVGGWFANRYYFLAGARLGLPVLHSSSISSTVHTYLSDPTLIGEMNNVPVHDAYTSTEKASPSWGANMLNAQLSAEVGLVLNSFWEKPAPKGGKGKGKSSSSSRGKGKKPILYRVGLFADYGLTSVFRAATPVALAEVGEPRQITLNNYFAASGVKVNSLLVGAKFAVLFQLNEIKPDKPKPSYFDILIADAETQQPIPASLTIYDKTKKRTTVRDAKSGKYRYRAYIGDYTITAANEQYISASQDASIQSDGVTEKLRFTLDRKPEPVVIDTPIIDIPVRVGTKVVLHNLHFATGKTYILPESEGALEELAAFMKQHPGVAIRITGHTDNIGSDEANMSLSEGRANAVRDELIKRGVQSKRVEAEGKGETEPIATNDTEQGRALNRRVEFTITATGDELIEQVDK